MYMICDLSNVNDIIHKEGLNLLVVCYGGCGSNMLVTVLEQNNYICQTNIWKTILCHSPEYIQVDIPIIYIYDNPIKSLISMKNRRRGCWDVNQRKLSNNMNIDLSDENLLKLMIKQFNTWTNIKRDNVLIVKTCELFEECIVDKLECFLKKKINYFPIIYKRPKTDVNNITDKSLLELFEKYKLEIDYINNFTGK